VDLLFPCLANPDDRVALRVGDRSLTQRELSAAIAHLVTGLEAEGIRAGAHVGVWTRPVLESLVAFVALAAAGYVMVPLDRKLGETELAHVTATAQPAVILDAPAIVTTGAPFVPRALTPGASALVLFTSGTTGLPKGALLTQGNIVANLDMLADAWAWTADDTIVHALPLFHVHGLVLGLFGALRAGGALHWVPRFTPEDVAGAVAATTERAVVFAVPTMYYRLCEAAERNPAIAAGMRKARLLVSGSAPLAVREHAAIERLFGQRPVERYGLTETLINCSTRVDGERRGGSVGLPLKGVQLKLVDDARRELSDDEARDTGGEIAVRGPHVFRGYVGNPEATAAVLVDGWFYTGDVARRSADGFITIVGRRSTDIIKCGGFKVGAGEVEAALCEHASVAEAAVIGAPDPDLGEKIVAFVVTRDTVEVAALQDHVARLLSPHKRPREVHVIDALPRNAMGKVQKTALKARV
jgi:malonyl-CoA/methylmalonyl-CoA synthetase